MLMNAKEARDAGVSRFGDADAPKYDIAVSLCRPDMLAVRNDRFPAVAAEVGQQAIKGVEAQAPTVATA